MTEWARRRRRNTVWHIVESHIEDRSVTRCGRQMHDRDWKGHELETVYAEPSGWGDLLCLLCNPDLTQKTR